jgi:hypothetical protein
MSVKTKQTVTITFNAEEVHDQSLKTSVREYVEAAREAVQAAYPTYYFAEGFKQDGEITTEDVNKYKDPENLAERWKVYDLNQKMLETVISMNLSPEDVFGKDRHGKFFVFAELAACWDKLLQSTVQNFTEKEKKEMSKFFSSRGLHPEILQTGKGQTQLEKLDLTLTELILEMKKEKEELKDFGVKFTSLVNENVIALPRNQNCKATCKNNASHSVLNSDKKVCAAGCLGFDFVNGTFLRLKRLPTLRDGKPRNRPPILGMKRKLDSVDWVSEFDCLEPLDFENFETRNFDLLPLDFENFGPRNLDLLEPLDFENFGPRNFDLLEPLNFENFETRNLDLLEPLDFENFGPRNFDLGSL